MKSHLLSRSLVTNFIALSHSTDLVLAATIKLNIQFFNLCSLQYFRMRPLAVQLALLVLAILLATVGKLNADDSHNEPEPTTATLAIVPMYVFPNGSLQVPDIDLLKSNASRQAEGVSNVTLGDVRQDNRTRETQLRNRNRWVERISSTHTNAVLLLQGQSDSH